MTTLFKHTPLRGAFGDMFAAFWAAYPHRRPNPRAKAEAAYMAAIRGGMDADSLTRAAEAFAIECTRLGTRPEYIPHTSTWLNEQRYRDYLAEVTDARDAPSRAAASADAMQAHPLWAELRNAMAPAEFRSWFLGAVVQHRDAESVRLAVPNKFHVSYIAANYTQTLCQALGVQAVYIEVAA